MAENEYGPGKEFMTEYDHAQAIIRAGGSWWDNKSGRAISQIHELPSRAEMAARSNNARNINEALDLLDMEQERLTRERAQLLQAQGGMRPESMVGAGPTPFLSPDELPQGEAPQRNQQQQDFDRVLRQNVGDEAADGLYTAGIADPMIIGAMLKSGRDSELMNVRGVGPEGVTKLRQMFDLAEAPASVSVSPGAPAGTGEAAQGDQDGAGDKGGDSTPAK